MDRSAFGGAEPSLEVKREALLALLREVKATSAVLARADHATRQRALAAMADALEADRDEILAANAEDLRFAEETGLDAPRKERLTLNPGRIRAMADGLRALVELPDPLAPRGEMWTRPNGLLIERVPVPLGVIAIIYESRPNVTADAAGLAIKSGSAVVLRGGREAHRSNAAIAASLQKGLRAAGLPEKTAVVVPWTDRELVEVVLTARGLVDLAIPRGGHGLIQYVVRTAQVPTLETGVGNNHLFVDRSADFAKATRIVVDAKTDRPAVCNALETLLVHREIAEEWLPEAGRALVDAGVELRGCPESVRILRAHGIPVREATEEDWETEYLDLILAVRVVGGLDEALAHIARYGTGHSEAIVAEDRETVEAFLAAVDAAAVYHNASTRFTDGREFGFGAEMGISTQKLHARGPVGPRELVSYKYIVRGNGQVRGFRAQDR